MLIYIRHGDDRSGGPYRHDRELTKQGRAKAAKQAVRLIKKYGHPNTVHVSPFRRTLETLEAMTSHFLKEVQTQQDLRVAQRTRKKKKQLHPATLAILSSREPEDPGAFYQRVVSHAKEIVVLPGVTWIITHRAVLKKVAKYFSVKEISLDFLDYFVIIP